MKKKNSCNNTYTCLIDTPLGQARAAARNGAITGLWFVGQKHFPSTDGWTDSPDYPVFKGLKLWLDSYFKGTKVRPELHLDPEGTSFQIAVWQRLRKIPCGQVTTYGAIARDIADGKGSAAAPSRAVGGAVGRNPISILIPCHRVIGSDGTLTGYAGGLERKRELLRREGTLPPPPPLKSNHGSKRQG